MSDARPLLRFLLDGKEAKGREGDSVASALLAAGNAVLRNGPEGAPRGLFCGIGVCFECRMTIDGRTGERACMVRLREGMRVEREAA